MKFLYGTTNKAKIAFMQDKLKGLEIEIVSLEDLGVNIPYVEENGSSPLENATLKAKVYYEYYQMPVFSCDSGLYFENLPPELSPEVHVRNVNGIRLTDDEMIEYYGNLAKEYGEIIAYYKNAICLIINENNIYSDDSELLHSDKFKIVDIPHKDRIKGFPLDCLSKRVDTNEYFYDSLDNELVTNENGFKIFFTNVFNDIKNRD